MPGWLSAVFIPFPLCGGPDCVNRGCQEKQPTKGINVLLHKLSAPRISHVRNTQCNPGAVTEGSRARTWVCVRCISWGGWGAAWDPQALGTRWAGALCKAKSSRSPCWRGLLALLGARPAFSPSCGTRVQRGKKRAASARSPAAAKGIFPPLLRPAPCSIFLTASFPFFSADLSAKCFPSVQAIFIPLSQLNSFLAVLPGLVCPWWAVGTGTWEGRALLLAASNNTKPAPTSAGWCYANKNKARTPPNLPILTVFFPLQLVCGGDASYQSTWRDKIGVEQVEAVVWTSGCCTYRFWCLFKQNQYKQVGTKNPMLCTAGVCKLWYLLFKRFQACDLRLPIHVIFVMMSVFELGLSSSIIFRVFPCTGKVIISPHPFWEDFLPRLPRSTCSAFLLRVTEFIIPWK